MFVLSDGVDFPATCSARRAAHSVGGMVIYNEETGTIMRRRKPVCTSLHAD